MQSSEAASRHSGIIGWRELAVQAALLVVLLACVFPGTFFRGEIIVPGDILFQSPPWDKYAPEGWERPQNRLMTDVVAAFIPYYSVSLVGLENGEWPLWNPYEYGGMPLLANCQSTVLYPPRLVHAAFGLMWGTTLFILLKLWLCGATAYVCARTLKLGIPAARFFSVAWMLSTYNLIWCNWPLTDVSAWMPVLFAGVNLILDERYRRGFFATALGGCLLLYAGHPETAFTMGLGTGVYFCCRLAWERRRGRRLWRPVGVVAGAWGLALLVYAPQLLPFLEYLVNSSTFFERQTSGFVGRLTPSGAVAFWVPRFLGTYANNNYWGNLNSNRHSMVYPGIAVGILLPLAWTCYGTSRARRSRVVALAVAAALSISLAFSMPTINLVHRLPVFSSMIKGWHISVSAFALPMLAALAIDGWLARPRRLRELLPCLPMLLLGMGVVFFVRWFYDDVIRTAGVTEYVDRQVVTSAALAVAVCVVLVAYCLWAKPRVFASVLAAVLAVDFLLAARDLNPTLPAEHEFPDTALTKALQDLGTPCRVSVADGSIASGLVVPYGIEEWLGYDGVYPARNIRFRRTLGPAIWHTMDPACAIQYVLNDPRFEPTFPLDEPGRFEYVATHDGLEIHRNTLAFPHAYLVPYLRHVPDTDKMFEIMRQPSFDPGKEVLVERLPRHTPASVVDEARDVLDPLDEASRASCGTVTITRRTLTRVELDVQAARDCVLVLADAYYPGWRVRVDDRRAELFPAHYMFRGVVMEAGEHRVVFSYVPWSFRLGLLLAIAAMLASVGAVGYSWYAGSRSQLKPSETM